MQASLYIPFVDLVINDSDGQKILYENLVQSGPAYKLVVHESPTWLRIKDEMPWPEMIEIISEKEAQNYKEIVDKFFSPITEAIPYLIVGNKKQPSYNLTIELRRVLSYILIAHDHKSRIYSDDINERVIYLFANKTKLSNWLEQQKNVFSEEAIECTKFVEDLLSGYHRDSVPTLSVNRDPRIFDDLMDLLKKEEIKKLSAKNHLFGVLAARKDILVRDLKEITTQIVKNAYFPYLVSGVLLALSYYLSSSEMEKVISSLSGLGAKILSRFDFREYAPPIQSPRLFTLVNKSGVGSFSYKPFNYQMKIFVPSRH